MQTLRAWWLRIALWSSLLTPALHVVVLIVNRLNPITAPISLLSRGEFSELQHLALGLFGFAHIALALGIGGLDRGRLWPVARGALIASGIGLGYVAVYFAGIDDSALRAANANDPLWVIASLTGFAMGALQPGLSRLAPGLGAFGVVCLGVWLLLVPVGLLVDAGWIGAYERLVGSVYVIWMTGVSMTLLRVVQAHRAAAGSAQ